MLFLLGLLSVGCYIPALAAQPEEYNTPVDSQLEEFILSENGIDEEINLDSNDIPVPEEIDMSLYVYQDGGLDTFPERELAYVCNEEGLGADEYSVDGYENTDAQIAILKEKIYDAFINGDNVIDLSNVGFKVKLYSFRDYYSQVINAHPELFYISSSLPVENTPYTYDQATDNFYITSATITYKSNYDVDRFFEEADKALKVIKPGMTDVEKVIAVHEYLVLDCEYDYDRYLNGTLRTEHPDTYNAYGVLVDKQAVCNGYALAYMYLMNRAGVHTVMVSSSAVNHAWNMVEIDGYWYEVDCTWDDPIRDYFGMVRHNNLLCSDEGFPEKHKASDWVVKDAGVVVTDLKATNTKYDNAFWKYGSFVSQLINYDGYYYYIPFVGSTSSIKKIKTSDYNGNNPETLLTGIKKWNVWESSYFYTTSYASLELVGDKLIYTTPTTINSINIDGTNNKILYTLPGGTTGYIYGAHIVNDQMKIVINTVPNADKTTTKIPVDIGIKSSIRKISEASLDLADPGIITLKFYISNLDGSEKVYINDVSYNVSDSNRAGEQHVFSYSVVAKDIYKPVEVKVVKTSEPSKILELNNTKHMYNGVFCYSVSDYLNEVITNSSKYDNTLVDVCDSLLIYGDNAYAYFGGESSDMVSRVSIYADSNGDDPLAEYEMQFMGDNSLRDRFIGASLVLEDRIAIKMYYRDDDSANGVSTRYFSGFSACQLESMLTSSFDGGAYSIKYGPFSYIKKARDYNTNPKLIQLLEALYGYWYYSDAYFDAKYN